MVRKFYWKVPPKIIPRAAKKITDLSYFHNMKYKEILEYNVCLEKSSRFLQ